MIYIDYTLSFLLHAKEAKPDITPEQLSFDNRVRQFSTPDQIFNYFSSIQLVSSSGTVFLSSQVTAPLCQVRRL